MFNSILFDKSVFESLNIDEIFFLRQYYFPVVSHILIIEILADLKKNDNRDNQERVYQLAHKLLQLGPKYTMHYQELIETELSGNTVEMSHRPIIGQGRMVVSEDGKKGFVFEQPFEEKILQRWQRKEFNEADKISAIQWRKSIEANIINLKEITKIENIKHLKNLKDIILFVNQYINLPDSQSTIIENILILYQIDYNISSKVFYKFETKQFLRISDYAPYSTFCYKIFLVFSLAINRGIITPRKTDIIDLQYLYYLPFISIFTSNDKFHKMFAPLFVDNDQIFIDGFELKNDLKRIVELRDSVSKEDREKWIMKYRHYPPDIESSFTSDLWKKHVPQNFRKKDPEGDNKSPEENKKLLEMINRLANAPEKQDYKDFFKDEEIDFIVMKRKIGPDDLCPCGSGKLFKDCHLPEILKNRNT